MLRACALIATFGLLYWLMFPGCFQGWQTGYLGGARGDAGIYVYLESINAQRFFTWPSIGFDLPIFYPWKRALAFSDNFLLPALIAKFLVPIFGNEAVVYNLILVTAGILNGVVAYLLAYRVTASKSAALLAGFVFLSFPYFVFHRGHPQLQFGFWIPLTMLGAIRFAEDRRVLSAALIGAGVTGAFFCAVYYAMYCYLLAGLTLLGCFLLRPRSWRVRDLGAFVLGNVPWLVLLAPAAIPYMEVRGAMGTNPIAILYRHSPPLTSFIAAPPMVYFWRFNTSQFSSMEGFLFFGFIPLIVGCAVALQMLLSLSRVAGSEKARCLCTKVQAALALMACVGIVSAVSFSCSSSPSADYYVLWARSLTFWALLFASAAVLLYVGEGRERQVAFSTREHTALLTFLAVFFVFATLGINDTSRRVPELYRYLMLLPGFDALRGLSRMGIVAVLMVVLLAAIGVAEVIRRRGWSGTRREWVAVAFVMICCGAELNTPRNNMAPSFPAPPIYEAAQHLPTDEAVVALPMRSGRRDGRNFMMWNSLYVHWMRHAPNPVVNGFSGKVPFFHSVSSHTLDFFPSREALSMLGTLVGVRYVITNRSFYGATATKKILELASALSDEVKLLECDQKNNCIFRVNPIIETKVLHTPQLYIPPGKGARALEFDIQVDEPTSDGSVDVSFLFDLRRRERGEKRVVTLRSPFDWQSAVIELPPSNRTVNPTIVPLTVRGARGVKIRNLRVATRPNLGGDTERR